ncbi:cytochrome C [Aliarcobacter trophiarum LMG 25534]|uniref:Cytochrome C n=1 Tax=Aliarcobacter trophiarum LMG 25534 TaxID=1032241 RepID=A0AAD0VLX9_9BACT|nr:c-type cytochrome [Aliarcobacter trophiarum]AXK48798.1 monoheme c-type cytochrome [Aliarcobacter trophiarum LMG 25534]RXJ92119.1 cytochrome C [Aliarcobacter trophiarum LMG 25534]
MKTKNIIGLLLLIAIFALFAFTLSQESSKKVVEQDKVEEKVTKVESVVQKSDEEIYLEDLKKQAGQKVEYEVSAYYKVACSSCHGKTGNGTKIAPAIAGQSYEYLLSKLDDYKNGKVENSLMQSGLFININEEDLKKLAKEIANFK